ncbi:MAG: hypothetical protein K1X83_09510 [Oligoflexia bacterium]|nr:hypothetical protein [Oligoflexia bacterium]
MLRLVSAGAAFPALIIDSKELENLQPALIGQDLVRLGGGIVSRGSILNPEYLHRTKNTDPWQSKDELSAAPSDLTFKAVELALERAGITADQIGLIIGETISPMETTPGEGQRVGKRLNIKVPAYDVISGSSALLHYLSVISRWNEESIPDYVLFVSANTPTQRTRYDQGSEGLYFGDCCSAMIVSSRKPGRLEVRDIKCSLRAAPPGACEFDLYGTARLNPEAAASFVLSKAREILNKLKPELPGSFVILPQFSPQVVATLCDEFGIAPANCWSNVGNRGFTLGSGTLSVLAERWQQLGRDGQVIVCDVGLGGGYGYAVLKI